MCDVVDVQPSRGQVCSDQDAHATCKTCILWLASVHGPDGPFAQSGSRTVFEVLEGFFAVALLVAPVQTLHSDPLQTHVAGQVVSADIPTSEGSQRTRGTVRKKPMSKCFDIWQWCCFSQGWKLCNSHNFFANKDENFVLRQHAPNEVQQVRLFLLFADNQHRLLHWVHSLQHHRRDGGKGYCTSNAVHYLNICNTFLKARRLFRAYSLWMNKLIQCAVFIRTGTSWKQTNYWHH